MEEKIRKWRLILGQKADPAEQVPLDGQEQGMDDVMEALYDAERKGGLGSSAPNINRWLGDIRKYFPNKVVQVVQKDALDRLGLKQMLLEPELLASVEPDVSLVGTLLSLKKVMPQKTVETAREVVRKVVEVLEKKLRSPMQQALQGALNRTVRNRRPRLKEIDWNQTIRKNLKHYQPEYKSIIPELLIGHGRKNSQLQKVILLIDQSGSMASSVVYASVLGAIMASLRSIKTHFVLFDTAVVDMTDKVDDPVELLFGTQLGGGTDIHRALTYGHGLIEKPSDSIVVLISDLYEGANEQAMLKKAAEIKASGAQLIALLALNDKGKPDYDKQIAAELSAMNVPSFACTPEQFPDLMAAAIQKQDIKSWMTKEGIR